MIKWRDWDASSVTRKATKGLQQNCITLDELAKEVLPLLSPYAPITIEAQIPVFTEWVVSGSSWNIKPPKKISLNKQKGF
jgi:hypothetical protein